MNIVINQGAAMRDSFSGVSEAAAFAELFASWKAPSGVEILQVDVEPPRGVGNLDFGLDFEVFISSRCTVRIAPKHANRPKRRSKGVRTTSTPRKANVFWWMPCDKKGGAQ